MYKLAKPMTIAMKTLLAKTTISNKWKTLAALKVDVFNIALSVKMAQKLLVTIAIKIENANLEIVLTIGASCKMKKISYLLL